MPGMPREVSGKVLSLEVENFKSYRGQHSIGPFHAFTAVMGPNGSGKSNLMDAISFVLGVKGAQLRGSLRELLYSFKDQGQEEYRPERGHVTLVLETEELGTIRFTRAIIPGRNADAWTSAYFIDEQTVSWSAYEAKLLSYGILVKTRNFLVFQGDIEAVAAKKPEDLTKLFESISGSEAFKADHDRLEVECKDTEANLLFLQSRKKSTAAAKKQKKEQKDEAEKHLKLQAELAKLKATYYLWQLFHAQQNSEQADKERAERLQLLATAAEELKSIEAAVKVKKREVAGLSKQKILLEQKVKKRQAVAQKQSPEQIKAGIEKEHVAKKIKTQEKELQTIQAKEKEHEKKLAQLQKQLEDLGAAEEERAARRSSDGEMVDSATLSKYHRLMEEAKAKTARDRADLASLETVLAADKQTLKEQQDTLRTIVARVAELRAAAENMAQQRKAQEQELKADKQELENKRHERGQQEIKNRRNKATRLAVEERLRRLDEQIQESKASKRDRDKESQARETVAEMKRLFPGVHGRVSELGKVTQKSYNLALAVVMGSNIDSVVVDTERAAKECVAYLKQRRIPPMTFIPLQTIKVKPPNERLRDNLRGIASLAFDLLEFDSKLENAFIYVCGNTFVCDNEEEAKHLAFSGAERHKVVTKSGLLIAKSGAMTGGGTANLEAKAARFDEAHNTGLRQERAKLEIEVQVLESEQEGQRLYHHVQNEIRGLETKVALLEQEIQADKGRAAGNVLETQVMEKKRQEMEPQVEKLYVKVESQQGRVERIRKRMNEVEDRIFAPLSKEVGVASIREYIEVNIAAVEKREQERISLARQTAKVQQQLEYEVKAHKPETGKLLAELHRTRQRLEQLRQEERNASLAAEKVEGEVSSLVCDLERVTAAISEAEKVLRELKKEESAKTEAGSKLQRAVRDLDMKLDALALRQGDVLHMARLEQIEIPGMGEEEDDEAETMETVEAGQGAAKARAAVARLDFTQLSRQQRASGSAGDREKLDTEFKKDIEERQAALAAAAPNLKALEQYNEAKAKDEQEKVEVEEARRVRLEKVQAFREVQQRRRDAFMAAFNHISAVIDPIYKDLTKSSEAGIGGSGYLSLQGSEDECYMNGISFSVVPPGKRWRQMDELSGGEKTLAALALLFAIHSFRPSPFFVLDEIDAALDAKNVSKVANYIRSKTRTEGGQHEFQAVVISLKDSFFSKADALVGVTKEARHGSSNTFMLDLNRFGQPEH